MKCSASLFRGKIASSFAIFLFSFAATAAFCAASVCFLLLWILPALAASEEAELDEELEEEVGEELEEESVCESSTLLSWEASLSPSRLLVSLAHGPPQGGLPHNWRNKVATVPDIWARVRWEANPGGAAWMDLTWVWLVVTVASLYCSGRKWTKMVVNYWLLMSGMSCLGSAGVCECFLCCVCAIQHTMDWWKK